jgi:5'(3')-deoxyribonucleotidase
MIKNLKEKRIAIDIDDVISETIPNLLKYLFEYHDINIAYEDFKEYEIFRHPEFVKRNIDKNQSDIMWNGFFESKY